MRNVDDNRAAEHPQPAGGARVYTPALARRSRRRKAVIGAVGLLSILGGGAVVATQVFDDPKTTATSRTGALRPAVPDATPPAATPSSAAATGASPSAAAATPRPKTTEEQIDAVRSLAARPNDQVRRPPVPTAAAAAVDEADVTTTQVQERGETLKTVSAHQDLSGFRELSLLADKGTKYGDTRCTKKIRFSHAEKVRERPTLLLCWRTSAQKSVYTVAVKIGGRPSSALSVAAIDKKWAELG
jgi:hypothetical protein